jgi:phosphoribosylanthranilate isomerase
VKQVIVKYCGFQTMEAVQAAQRLPIEMMGFILAKSKRQVNLAKLEELTSAVTPKVLKVGVFVNPTLEEIDAAISRGNLDCIQLHGTEPASFCREVKHKFGKEILKALSVGAVNVKTPLDDYAGTIDYLLLDTYDPRAAGGTGKTFSWDEIPYYKSWCEHNQIKLLAAGGIHAGNIQNLLGEWSPDGIDISSGIETNGAKDLDKMKDFIERVRRS